MAKNPFADDDDDVGIKQANQRDAEKVREAVKEKVDVSADPDDATEVDLDQIEEERSAKAEKEGEERGSRTERRRDRYAERAEEAKAERERAERLEREVSEERTRRIALETQMQSTRQPQQPERDVEAEEILRIRQERKSTHAAWQARQAAGNMTPAERDEFEKRAYELNDRESYAIFLRNQRLSGSNNQKGLTAEDVQREAQKQTILNAHPDIFSHKDPNVKRYMHATHAQLIAKGAPGDMATIAKAADITRREFRIGNQRPAPDEAARRRLSGGGSGGGRSGGDNGSATVVRMNKDQKRMAEKAFPHLASKNPAEAHKQWANTAGRELLKKGVSS